jgi:hypothetical protein
MIRQLVFLESCVALRYSNPAKVTDTIIDHCQVKQILSFQSNHLTQLLFNPRRDHLNLRSNLRDFVEGFWKLSAEDDCY